MFGDGPLTFWEGMMREPFPLATVHDAILFEFLPGREDAVLSGVQAVNAYVEDARLTQDVDLVSQRAEELAEEVRRFLSERFDIAVRVFRARKGIGYRIDQVRKPKNRHLVDVWQIDVLPPSRWVKDVLVVNPPELICQKVLTMVGRMSTSTSFLDQADLYRLLLAFPVLKAETGPVLERLRAADAPAEALVAWKELAAREILPDDDESKFR
jgi:hypothetical protein